MIPQVSFEAAVEGQKAQEQPDRPARGAGSLAPHGFQEAVVASEMEQSPGRTLTTSSPWRAARTEGPVSSGPPLSGFKPCVREGRNTCASVGEELYQAEGED